MPGGARGMTIGPTQPPGSLGNRISPPSYASGAGLNMGQGVAPAPSSTQYVLPPTSTGTTVDKWGLSWAPVGATGTSLLPATGTVLDKSAFSFGGIDFTWMLLLVVAGVILLVVTLAR